MPTAPNSGAGRGPRGHYRRAEVLRRRKFIGGEVRIERLPSSTGGQAIIRVVGEWESPARGSVHATDYIYVPANRPISILDGDEISRLAAAGEVRMIQRAIDDRAAVDAPDAA